MREYATKRIMLKQPGITAVEFVNLQEKNYNNFIEWGQTFIKKIRNDWAYNNILRMHREEARDTNVLIVGLPNTGKSTLINVLRQAGHYKADYNFIRAVDKKRPEGDKTRPGSTKKVQEKVRVSESPLIYMTDTPGVNHHRWPSLQVALKMSVTNLVKQTHIGVVPVADYILFELNRQRIFNYVDALDLTEGPCDDIQTVLKHICRKNNLYQNKTMLTGTGSRKLVAHNYHSAAQWFLLAYKRGMFGRVFWDQDVLDREYLAVQGSLLKTEVLDASEAEVDEDKKLFEEYQHNNINNQVGFKSVNLKLEVPELN